jgi:cysteine desulfurase family protein
MRRVYLDNAATSWPKPPQVYQAVDHAMRQLGAPAGRGNYAEAAEVDGAIRDTRRLLAGLLGVDDARQVVFAFNGTDALNLVLYGLLGNADHVVATDSEHNSVFRPLRQLHDSRGVNSTLLAVDGQGVVDPDEFRKAVCSRTRLFVVSHASNVTGAVQPVAEIAQIAQAHGVPLLVDAAQTLGHWDQSPVALGASLVAASGHKGLLGPLGTGLAYIAPELVERIAPWRLGGTGTESESDRQPEQLPDKFESGNLNVPGILGLRAALEWITAQGLETLRGHEQRLTAWLLDEFSAIPGLRCYGPPSARDRVGVVSIGLDGVESHDLAAVLESSYRIQVRAGLHCAPRIHRSLGTLSAGGTVRFSVGPFTSLDELTHAAQAVRKIGETLT